MTSKEALGLKADEVAIRLNKQNKEIIYRALKNEVARMTEEIDDYVDKNVTFQTDDLVYCCLKDSRDGVSELAESLVNGTLEL